jgi:hypothetical protein
MNMDVILFRTFSNVIMMRQKVDPCTERGLGILIKESSIKVIDVCHDSGKAQLIINIVNTLTVLFGWEIFMV